jgi:N-acetylmuramoyl-L-alanine amidase
MSKIRAIVHCSASRFGTASWLDKLHREERGWNRIGYHAVIKNGFEDASYLSVKQKDGTEKPMRVKIYNGSIETGRVLDSNRKIEWDEVGAHAYGNNRDTVAVCLIGGTDSSGEFSPFTKQQVIALVKLLKLWKFQFGIRTEDVLGHCELEGVKKTCPEIPMDTIRSLIRNKDESIRLFRSLNPFVQEVL